MHELLVVHPNHFGPYRWQIKSLQQGLDPIDPADDPVVLCYISIGEVRTHPHGKRD